jgi:hypothetical protein
LGRQHPDRKVPAEVELLPIQRGWFAHENDLAAEEGGTAFNNLFDGDYAIKGALL